MSAELLRELYRAKAAFQLRTIETIIRGPASVDTLPKGGDAKQGSVRSKGSAVPERQTPETPRNNQTREA